MKTLLTALAFTFTACYGQMPTVDDTAKLFIYKGARYDRIFIQPDTSLFDFRPMMINPIGISIMPKEENPRKIDTIEVVLLVTSDNGPIAFRMEGYSVRELHNTTEGLVDPGICGNCDYHDYYEHIYYIDKNKLPLSKNIIVWQSKEVQ